MIQLFRCILVWSLSFDLLSCLSRRASIQLVSAQSDSSSYELKIKFEQLVRIKWLLNTDCYLNLMINEQIFLWILKNNQVYLRQLTGHSHQAVKNSLTSVIDQLGKVLGTRLIEGKITSLNDFFTFYVETEEKSGIKSPSVYINGSLKILTHFKQSNIKPSLKEDKQVFVDIASALMLEPAFVQSFVGVYIKAINDLISNGNELSLDLHICRIKLSKKQSSYQFRTSFISMLNQRTIEPKNKRILLHTCPNSKCHQPKQNITTSSSHFYQAKWAQIKHGNLYNRPSLQQIKQLYDKGRELQLKYHHFFI